jgi:dihydrolipoamide dehydrogenase
METRQVDVAIIGAGTAGLNARRAVEREGGRPLLIESGPYGTTCARVGCMPSKLVIAAAEVAHEIDGAARFGIRVPEYEVDGSAVMDRVRSERDRFAGGVVRDTEALPEEQRLRGHARFTGPTSLLVDNRVEVKARAVIIAAGSSPHIPPPFEAIRDRILTNDDVFELERLPSTLAVVGTGIIGLELGQALHRLGVDVTFFSNADTLGPVTDPAVQRVMRDILGKELKLNMSATVEEAIADPSGVWLRWRNADGGEQEEQFEKVLVATGRRPNLDGLELERTGAKLDDHGRPEWDPTTTQLGDLPIFMAGDASGHIPLLHEAADEGRIAGENAMRYPEVSAHRRRTPLGIAFTDPQIAMVGKRYDQLDLGAVEIGQASFDNQGRARVIGQNRGLLRVYADKECCSLIGAEMFTPRAEHMAHLLAWAVDQRMRVSRSLQMPFYHPVLEEGLRSALRELVKKLRVTGECRCEDMAMAPGA